MTLRTPFDGCLVTGCPQEGAVGCCGFCVDHWRRVPEAVRVRLLATFRRSVPGPDYYEALRDAREEATRERP